MHGQHQDNYGDMKWIKQVIKGNTDRPFQEQRLLNLYMIQLWLYGYGHTCLQSYKKNYQKCINGNKMVRNYFVILCFMQHKCCINLLTFVMLFLYYYTNIIVVLFFLTPPMPVPSPDEKGGGLDVGLATPLHKKK